MVPEAPADTTWKGHTDPEPTTQEEAFRALFVTFRLNNQAYALPLDIVERALRMVAMARLPEGPSWVAGGINLHGKVIPVIDLRRRFGQPPREATLHDRLLVVRPLGQTVALIVDEVSQVLEVARDQVEPLAYPLCLSRILAAVIRREGELILVLDPEVLLPPASGREPLQPGSGHPGGLPPRPLR